MRITLVCLLGLLSSVAVAWAAPAPFAKSRDTAPALTVEQLTRHLRDHHQVTVERIAPQRKRGEWIVVGTRDWNQYTGFLPSEFISSSQVAYLVKFQGLDGQGQPQLTLVHLEQAQKASQR